MRLATLILPILLLAGCAEGYSTAEAIQLADGTWRIEGPKIAYESDVPNEKKAVQICPDGYNVLKRHREHDGLGVNVTIWIVDCD